MSGKPTDLELMMLADGELPAERAREVAAAVERDPTMRAKLEALGHLGESVRTYLETETDEAERVPKFADMWATIEREIGSKGIREPAHRAPPATAPTRPRAPAPGPWAGLVGWFEGHRGHLMTGLVSAGAVAGLMLALRPEAATPTATRVTIPPPTATAATTMPCAPDAPSAAPSPPEVESFEVYEGSGMVFTLPRDKDDADDESGATVIWISKDQDTEEDPI